LAKKRVLHLVHYQLVNFRFTDTDRIPILSMGSLETFGCVGSSANPNVYNNSLVRSLWHKFHTSYYDGNALESL